MSPMIIKTRKRAKLGVAGFALLFALGIAPAPVLSQQSPSAIEDMAEIDETALRYFARQGDQVRLQAEIARLSALYPGWVPPADPLATEQRADPFIETLWDLYATGDYAAIREAIAERAASEGGWRPPLDLTEALERGEAVEQLVIASEAGEDETVIAIAATRPELLVCANMDLLWRVGEAFVDTQREARALELYTFILTQCEDPGERLATVQKARLLLDRADLESLFVHERDSGSGAGEFQSVRLDLARGAIADTLNGITQRVDPADLGLLEAHARETPMAGDLRLLGYYFLDLERPRQAVEWFTRALEAESSEESVMGLSIALMEMSSFTEAESLLADYRFESEALEDQYIAAVVSLLSSNARRAIDANALSRIADAASQTRSPLLAESLGWYAFDLAQIRTAADWFGAALRYDANYEPGAYGLLVASQRLSDTAAMRQIVQQWGERSPRIRLFGTPNAPTTAPMRYEGGWPSWPQGIEKAVLGGEFSQYRLWLANDQLRSARQCGTYVPPETISPAQALQRGWCLLDLERPLEALAAFQRAMQTTATATRTDAAYGMTYAYLRLGMVDDAAVAASAMPQTAAISRELEVAILAQTASTYFALGRYEEAVQVLDRRAQIAPEQNDLLTIRAWSYYHTRRLGEARRLFLALAAAGHQDALNGLLALGIYDQ